MIVVLTTAKTFVSRDVALIAREKLPRTCFIDSNKSLTYCILPTHRSEHLICDTNAFHSFCDALDYVGLDGILVADEDHYTAFVPHNNAFQDLLYHCDVDYIDDFPVNTLKDLLLYHIHEGEIFDKDDLQDRCGDLLLMKNDENTRTTCSYSRNKIFQKGGGNPPDNKPRIISFDIDACNGIVHAVNRVILPRYVVPLPINRIIGSLRSLQY